MLEIYNILKYLEPIELEKLVLPPNINLVDIEVPNLHRIMFLNPIPISPVLNSFLDVLNDMLEIQSGVCPTCGKKLIDNTEHIE